MLLVFFVVVMFVLLVVAIIIGTVWQLRIIDDIEKDVFGVPGVRYLRKCPWCGGDLKRDHECPPDVERI